MTKTIRKLLGYLLILCLMLSCVSALAETGTVKVKVAAQPAKGFNNPDGIVFEAFKVADLVDGGTTWKAASDFSVSAKGFETAPADGSKTWSDAEIKAILEKIEADMTGKKPVKTAVTANGGVATFDALESGIYYIRKNADSKTRLTGSASLVALPSLGESSPYSIEIDAKYEFEALPTTDFPVAKVWQDDSNFDGIQPESITVRLHRTLDGVNDAGFEQTAVLNADNKWTYTWTGLNTVDEDNKAYAYSVTEDGVTGYTPAIVGGTITNSHSPEYGAIRVTKQVTVNGQATTGKQADGTYRFTITGPSDADYTKSGKKKNSSNYLDGVPFEITVADGKSSSWTRDKLMPGTYVIRELTDGLPSGMSIANGEAQRSVEVAAGTTADTPAEVTYVNNLALGSIRITKQVTVNGSSTSRNTADGTYRFTVKGPSYPNGETVSIRITNGRSNTVQLDNLLLGEYEVSEVRTGLPTGVSYVSGDAKKTLAATNTASSPLAFTFVNNRTVTTPPSEPRSTPTPSRSVPPTPTPTASPTPTPTPTPLVSIVGEKVWRDDNNAHNTRPESIKVQLLRDGEQIREITVTGGAGNRWSFSFGELPKVDEKGSQYSYTVRETPVEGYTTTIRGTSIINELVRQTPRTYTSLSGNKIWKDDDDSAGERPNYITIRLMRNGREVDRRTVTAANGWQFTFQNVPVDDGYGNNYSYAIREDAVTGYVGRADGFVMTNSRLPQREEALTELTRYGTPLAGFGEPELEGLMELFDYGTPLWGRPLKTGDEVPLYPIVFGGVGAAALIALAVLMVLNKKRGHKAV